MAKVTLYDGVLARIAADAGERGLRGALGKAETVLKEDILRRPGSGKIYGKHQASAPGEPPAPDTGNLRSNTNADPNIREEGDDLVGRVVSNAEYAQALEKGTERMAARPFMGLLGTDHAEDLRQAFIEGAKQ
ncbi:HK97 gp10 family phage protein [Brevundimonas sp.]|uniref:HK97 gp10 family phage protein n=1 Tax=Brevundimonas sp. TaxID=1871086 RepID=UPI00289A78F0|nr:HK97 gp10 family phage protein [Brevundimonas sp.]